MKKLSGRIALMLLFVGLFCMMACQQKSAYHQMLETELASGIRNDSLFLGISLGMSAKDFYAECWKLNEQKLIKQGEGNNTVVFQTKDLKYPARMNFFPEFKDEKIIAMPVTFIYSSWAPWNKEFGSENLQKDVINVFEQWYGKGFLEIEGPGGQVIYVKIDGNRQIKVETEEPYVKVMFTDLKG